MRNPVSRFSYAPTNIGIPRSRFARSSTHKTTFNAGRLIPIFVDEYLPGDTFKMDTSVLARMSTPVFPVMDNAYLDIYFFSVPYRLIWDNWKAFMGESPEDPYVNPIKYSIPQLKAPSEPEVKDVPYGSILDYLGLPSGTTIDSFSALPVRAYCEIWNQWFRDQNLQNAIDYPKGDADYEYLSPSDITYPHLLNADPEAYVTECAFGGYPAPVNKYHDYFTSALPQPQKGDPVAIPLNGFAPVYALGGAGSYQESVGFGDNVKLDPSNSMGDGYSLLSDGGNLAGNFWSYSGENPTTLKFSNLYANLGASSLSGMDVYATINDLRYAFQVQKLLEADNRYGTRYIEIIKGHFNVDSPDGLLQRPEFLGGKRVHINMQQVVQTSSTDDISPQGNTAAYSLTIDRGSNFTKSFTEHGIIMGVCCVRTQHTYQQGVERFWNRKDRYDFYFPELANISEQPILNKEIWNGSTGYSDTLGVYNPTKSNEFFGYQEAWADYRYKPNRVSGYFRSTYPSPLDSWHYADFYNSQPFLSSEWIRETDANINRTLAVPSNISDQFLCDFYFDLICTRPMPLYSIPGLSDHH